MAQELDFQEKEKLDQEGAGSGDLYLFINVHSHELFKRSDENYSLSSQYQSLTRRLEHQLKFQQLMEVKQKLKYQQAPNQVNNLD